MWSEPPQDTNDDVNGTAPPAVQVAGGFVPMSEGTFLSGTTEMAPGQLIMLQPPSSAAKVIGVLAILWGVISAGGSLLAFLGPMNTLLMVINVLSFGLAGATVAGGVMTMNYQRQGVILLLLTVLAGTVVGGIELTNTEAIYDEMLQTGDLTQDDYDLIMANNGLVEGIGLVFLAVCNGICGLIIAIPLFVSNNGLDESKLFGSL